MFYKTWFKRGIDIIFASLMFLFFLPVIFSITLILIFHHGGSPIFRQSRPGKDGEIFQILKFKTMKDSVDAEGKILADSERITGIGRLIRKSSLDEIPQLINVIIGDMSLVGPRPLLEDYLILYSTYQSRRHEVRPGVTGWAQVNGRNAISWDTKFKLDVWYVDNLNVLLDMKILFQTLYNVLRGKGVTQQGHISMGRFEGSKVEK